MEGIGIGNIGILLLTQIRQHIQKCRAFQKANGADALLLVEAKNHVPVRVSAVHQFSQGRFLLVGKLLVQAAAVRQLQGCVQKYLMDFRDIVRKGIDKFSPVCLLGTDDPQHKLVLRHLLNILVHPCGHAAVNIGIA
nr:unnamed protein product [uncultured bacterium]